MLTALSLGLRPRESGQLPTIIPHNHGITITYIYEHQPRSHNLCSRMHVVKIGKGFKGEHGSNLKLTREEQLKNR